MKLVDVADIPKGEPFDVRDLKGADELHDTMIESLIQQPMAVGLSAVQLGIPYQCFIIRHMDIGIVFFNASYTGYLDKEEDEEGCLSLPGELYLVPRYPKIAVSGLMWSEQDKALIRIEKAQKKKIAFFKIKKHCTSVKTSQNKAANTPSVTAVTLAASTQTNTVTKLYCFIVYYSLYICI